MRLISFALTRPQIEKRTKDVTRRLGWEYLKIGERVQGCAKVMGRRHGEPLERLAVIKAVDVRREPLRRLIDEPEYGAAELRREGFPGWDAVAWVSWFCASHKGCTPETLVTRIEFIYDHEH